MIKNAVNSLSNGKDDKVYHLYSDNFIHATDLAFEILGVLIGTMLKHGTASELINRAIVKPIPKNKNNSLSESTNYRAISKNSILSKIIDYVLISLIGEKLALLITNLHTKLDFQPHYVHFLL